MCGKMHVPSATRTGGASALLVAFEAEHTVDVPLTGADSLHGTNNSVLQVDGANMDGLK